MGEVYEVEDLELRECVALKVLRPEGAESAAAQEGLKREISLARKVNHPNVCRIFELGFHTRPAPLAHARIPFLTMELLQGETLAELLRRNGRLSPGEALPLVRQIAEGLGAAHEAGIVHRDLKSANVFLVRARPDEPPRAVVSDFGLAQALREETSRATGSGGAALVGTPAYMAPEQVQGRAVTPATDIYALGVILYEMLTGRRPFEGDDPWSVATLRLQHPAPSPRRLHPELDERWVAITLRCLEREPGARFQSARELLLALPDAGATRALRRQRRRQVPLLLAALIGGAFVGGQPSMQPTSPTIHADHTASARRSVALLGFKNLAARPDAAWLSTALSETLVTELAAGEQLRTVPGEAVMQMKSALSLAESDTLTQDTLARVRDYLGCDLVVLGSYLVTGNRLRFDLRIQDTNSAAPVTSVVEIGSVDELPDLIFRAGESLRRDLGLEPPRATWTQGRSSLPSGLPAMQRYSEGILKLRQGDAQAARGLLEQAVSLEPGHPLPHAALAEALRQLGYDALATDELRTASSLSNQLSRHEEKLLIGAMYCEATFEWKKAVDLYRTLFEFFPDNVEYGLGLARAQQNSGPPEEVFTTLATLRRLPPPAGLDPRIDEQEARTALASSDYSRAQAAAARAASRAEEMSDWLRAAAERQIEFDSLHRQHENTRAVQPLREAIRLYRRSGSRLGEAMAMLLSGEVLPEDDWRGRLDAARKAEAIFLEIGNRRQQVTVLREIEKDLGELGDLRGAIQTIRGGLDVAREIGDRGAQLAGLNDLGVLHVERGELKDASDCFQEELQIARELKSPRRVASALDGMGDVAHARGDIAEARKRQQEILALAWREDIPWLKSVAPFNLAVLAMDEGHVDEAEQLANEALRGAKPDLIPWIQRTRAQVFLAQGRFKEALDTIEQVREPLPHLSSRLRFQVERARILGLAGTASDRLDALASLQAALEEGERDGLVQVEFNARLVLGEIELASGQTMPGLAHLRALELESKARGLGLWAMRVATARARASRPMGQLH